VRGSYRFLVERTPVIIQLPMFSNNSPLKNTLEDTERHAIALQHQTELKTRHLGCWRSAFIVYTYLLMQNMYFIAQKEMLQQLKNRKRK